MVNVVVGQREIGPGQPAYLIAELGINHGGDVEVAKQLVAAAAQAGADAVKLQTYRTDLRVPEDSPIRQTLEDAELDAAAHEALRDVARDEGVDLLSTPFDEDAIELLESLDVRAYKIASFDLVNHALVESVARRGRPMIMSRGMATDEECDRAVALVREHGTPLVLLHCVSAYPLDPADANLAVMDALRDRYDLPVGFSDHTTGIDVPVYAVARGAAAIEKHFTLDREADGPDHALSADPDAFRAMVDRVREVERVVGSPEPRRLAAEEGTLPYRRPSAPGGAPAAA